ncbi:MAG: hypothetical protein ABSG65_15905 [Bryobacteraceae bacterium]|jgi:hypothetical protein
MAVSKDDRKEYEQGVNDSHKGVLETAFNDIIVNHPDSSAYYKGRDRKQLDNDKKSDKK